MSKMNFTGGEAFPFATLEGLMNKLDSRELLQFAEAAEIDTSLESWLEMLQFISDFLEDAEDKQLTVRAVKSWLSKLRDLVYDAEDIVDALYTEMLRSSVSDSDSVARMSSEMQKITKGLEDLEKRIGKLGLKCPTEIKSSKSIKEERITTSLLDPGILGREEDKEAILNLLPLSPKTTYEPPSSGAITGIGGYTKPSKPRLIGDIAGSALSTDAADKLLVIPMWGMGGIGKTTLAQLVYNDVRVKKSFDPKVWFCVSDIFDVLGLTKIILKKVGVDVRDDDKDLSDLQERLKEKLVGKRFMIVLDDVWCEDRHKWESFCKPLRAAGTASTIIVTCRNEDVALMTGTVQTYRLEKLSEENCLSLIVQKALKANDFSARPVLEPIGKKIARKCQGSPLAAKTLGGLLANKSTPDEWEVVLQSKIWDLPKDESRILPALRLSYHHLPSSLKQCFAYLSIFPKDYEFERDALVLLWMAEGFLEQQQDGLQMEDLGHRYVDDLVSRSLLQQSTNNPSIFVMHDLTHDLAEFVAGEICFRLEDGLPRNKTHKVFEKVRHSSYARQEWEVARKFDPFCGAKYLRTLLALPFSSSSSYNYIAVKLIDNLLSQFRWLRVLGLSRYQLSELPDSVGDLKHLRYLNLSWTAIRRLPESISKLHNLQSLILDYCQVLSELPRGITSLTNLRHLRLINTICLREMPPGLGSLKGLQNLSKFRVGKENGLGIQELEHLSDLRGGLFILGLKNIVDVQQAIRAQLKEKQHLKELKLDFGGLHVPDEAKHQMLVFDSLQPHTNIQGFHISNYLGSKFPRWMGNPLFYKIVSISLYNCGACSSLPSLGKLFSLKNLYIRELPEVRRVDIEFYGDGPSAFPSLETLTVVDMRNWETWHGVGKDTFSCLHELCIVRCPKLVEVSALSLPSLCTLKLEGCKEVVFRSLRDLNSVTTLTIKNISGLVCLGEDLNEQMTTLETLETLEIEDCRQLKCLWKKRKVHQLNESLAHLTKLVIYKCCVFECFGAEEKEDGRLVPCNSPLVQLNALADLRIRGCDMFVSFGGIRFPLLRHLLIHGCYKWESLPESECESDTCPLEHLEISCCPSFTRFPDGGMPKTIKWLLISNCEKLESLPDGIMNNHGGLEELKLDTCSSLRHFPQGDLPISLKTLHIMHCKELESISDRKMMPNSNIRLEELQLKGYRYLKALPECTLINLTSLQIWSCDSVESFWEGGFLAPKLKRLSLSHCPNLRCMTDQIQSLTSLENLLIDSCSGLEWFPEAGFPTSLVSLQIRYCKNVKQPISKWGLHKLTSLREFYIEKVCLDTVGFGDDFVLPSSLTSLEINDFPNLVSLSLSLQNLIFLQHLRLHDCPKLQPFPKELLALLPQLSSLKIIRCPYLSGLCKEYWPHISLIPVK